MLWNVKATTITGRVSATPDQSAHIRWLGSTPGAARTHSTAYAPMAVMKHHELTLSTAPVPESSTPPITAVSATPTAHPGIPRSGATPPPSTMASRCVNMSSPPATYAVSVAYTTKRYSDDVTTLPALPIVPPAMLTRSAPGYHVAASKRSSAVMTMYAQHAAMETVDGMNPTSEVLTGSAMMPAPTVPPAMSITAPKMRAVGVPSAPAAAPVSSGSSSASPAAATLAGWPAATAASSARDVAMGERGGLVVAGLGAAAAGCGFCFLGATKGIGQTLQALLAGRGLSRAVDVPLTHSPLPNLSELSNLSTCWGGDCIQ
mmetsp:Transcript_15529/g.48829  ORF Transcript_15529/g.48829 Transcript_15529/m.48829 type:complete len:318 (-) Transcript_15529:137-1090(-)